MITVGMVYKWLEEVKDPEIPVLSLVDLGIIREIRVENTTVNVIITPTFVGCPALEMMKSEIHAKLQDNGVEEVRIDVSYSRPWTSDHISEKGRIALKHFGLAPPPPASLINDLDILSEASCPRCAGTNTVMRTPFGPTLCRSIHYCYDCREAFEQFKPL
jgi:ring-1,2-phenylacetyl-CoA epoxidase subunit PaaD